MLSLIKKHYPDPSTLPYHIIVPSLPGYAFSSSPPVDRDFKAEHMAPVMDSLMQALGLGDGYIAQGGDLGSFIARQLGVESPSCKAFHLNLYQLPAPANAESLPISEQEKKGLERGKAFRDSGSAYAMEHGTRTATIGLTLSSSPLALLSWIGEKFLEWTDEDPSLDEILDSVSLYWLTDTYARCIYPYRSVSLKTLMPSPNPPCSFGVALLTLSSKTALRFPIWSKRKTPLCKTLRQTPRLLLLPLRNLPYTRFLGQRNRKFCPCEFA